MNSSTFYSKIVKIRMIPRTLEFFPKIQSGNIGTFLLVKIEIQLDLVSSKINLNSMHHNNFKFAQKTIHLGTIYNLFLLERTQNVNVANSVYCGKTRLKYVMY